MAPWMLAMISGKRRVVTETFTSSQPWVCPLGVSRINTLTGKGADGSSLTTRPVRDFATNVDYIASGSAGGSAVTWANFNNVVTGWTSTLNSTGNLSYTRDFVNAYPDGTAAIVSSTPQSINGAVPGTASLITLGAWASSGAITASGTAEISYNVYVPAAPGADTTGFGYAFAGGAANTPATPVAVDNVPVTGGASYSLVVPAGGSITISYFR